ncbi:hypothetical protein F5884DRAFT_792545 [Xylogone sp. PMI_703]|nr:hypothetical protein F5884DRAFT_792545 [Xylogone sp. PMI_703]
MAESPSKRRKTSPTTSVPVDAPTTPTRNSALRQDGARTFSARPSFASPTRASLARHNPQLLNRATSPRKATERSGYVENSVPAGLYGDENRGRQPTTSESASEVNNDIDTALTETSQFPARRQSRSEGGNISAGPRRPSLSPGKRTPKINTMDEAPEASDAENHDKSPFKENINPFKRGGLRRSPVISQAQVVEPNNTRQDGQLFVSPAAAPPSTTPTMSERAETLQHTTSTTTNAVQSRPEPQPRTQRPRPRSPTEPQLPPTPSQRGILDPIARSTPTGIHHTPGKRARKNKERAEPFKASPLKSAPAPVLAPKEVSHTLGNQKENVDPRKRSKARRSARFAVPDDPHVAKRKIRDDLREELKQLRRDVALATKETERLRQQYESGQVEPTAASNTEELLDLLVRATEPESPPEPEAKPISAFQSIRSFLPFSTRPKKPPIETTPVPIQPPSHRPVAVEDPLGHLSLFSPLKFSSNIILLPPTPPLDSGDPSSLSPNQAIVLQKHLITARSPSGLFSSRLSMTVNPKSLSIVSIDIEKLDPAAEHELGPFIRQKASDQGALGRDIGVICWAMARWFETALLRARFWCAVESEFGSPEARRSSYERYQQSNRKKRKRPVAVMVEGEDAAGGVEDDDTNNDGSNPNKKLKWTKRQLLPHMGRTAMEIEGEGVELRVEWKVGFDWTGEVENSVSAATRFPRSWQEMDERDSLAKIPETFDRLVKEKGPLGAVRTIVRLLMPPA